MIWPFSFHERRGSSLACRLTGRLDGVKRMTARQESRPEEMPFDEPAEEPLGQARTPNRRRQMILEDPSIHRPPLRLNS